ncbi:uncharacterized protein LOC123902485 [Trifolium pratense]|uniref:uncharacterized protein LOC123902485 n=1 Tax=Trifolium pratense TaxID=57577 RepID=UPI001E6942C6|nr:uncharacterized protein LOC123902485 [Trifolium pratense]
MYSKVKLRQEQHHDDDDQEDEGRDLGLKAFLSLSFLSPTSPVKDHKVVSVPSIVKVPECYVPQVIIPRVSLTEDFGDCSLPSDSSGSAELEKDEDTDESKVYIRADLIPRVPVANEAFRNSVLTSDLSGHGGLEKDRGPEKDDNTEDENIMNIRASSIPRPRAVISSPENDHMIGNRNKIGKGRLPASKNSTVSPNRHALAQCKVKPHDTTDIPPDARKCAEPKFKDKIDTAGKKKVLKGSIKSDNLHRHWKF